MQREQKRWSMLPVIYTSTKPYFCSMTSRSVAHYQRWSEVISASQIWKKKSFPDPKSSNRSNSGCVSKTHQPDICPSLILLAKSTHIPLSCSLVVRQELVRRKKVRYRVHVVCSWGWHYSHSIPFSEKKGPGVLGKLVSDVVRF